MLVEMNDGSDEFIGLLLFFEEYFRNRAHLCRRDAPFLKLKFRRISGLVRTDGDWCLRVSNATNLQNISKILVGRIELFVQFHKNEEDSIGTISLYTINYFNERYCYTNTSIRIKLTYLHTRNYNLQKCNQFSYFAGTVLIY